MISKPCIVGLVVLLAAPAALAHEATITRGAVAPAAKAVAAPAKQTPLPQRPPDPSLDLTYNDTTRRLGGFADDQATGGSQCRTTCAKSYYMCLSADDAAQCSPAYARCTVTCPSVSGTF